MHFNACAFKCPFPWKLTSPATIYISYGLDWCHQAWSKLFDRGWWDQSFMLTLHVFPHKREGEGMRKGGDVLWGRQDSSWAHPHLSTIWWNRWRCYHCLSASGWNQALMCNMLPASNQLPGSAQSRSQTTHLRPSHYYASPPLSTAHPRWFGEEVGCCRVSLLSGMRSNSHYTLSNLHHDGDCLCVLYYASHRDGVSRPNYLKLLHYRQDTWLLITCPWCILLPALSSCSWHATFHSANLNLHWWAYTWVRRRNNLYGIFVQS